MNRRCFSKLCCVQTRVRATCWFHHFSSGIPFSARGTWPFLPPGILFLIFVCFGWKGSEEWGLVCLILFLKCLKFHDPIKTCKNSEEIMGVMMAVLVVITIKININYDHFQVSGITLSAFHESPHYLTTTLQGYTVYTHFADKGNRTWGVW